MFSYMPASKIQGSFLLVVGGSHVIRTMVYSGLSLGPISIDTNMSLT